MGRVILEPQVTSGYTGMSVRSVIRAIPKDHPYAGGEAWYLVEADYKGAELLVAAIASGDKVMLDHCRRNQLPEHDPNFFDTHSNLTVEAFRLPCAPTKAGLASIGKKHLRNGGKCVVAGTRIHTDRGWLPVESLADGLAAGEAARWIGVPTRLANHGKATPLLAVYNAGSKRCVEVTTELGYSLAATKKHQFLVVDESGRLSLRLAGKLRVGDWVCVRQAVGPFGDDTAFPQVDVEKRTNYKHLTLPSQFDEDWAAFLGLFVAEGYIDGTAVKISLAVGASQELADETEKLLQRVFSGRHTTKLLAYEKYQDQHKFSISSVQLTTLLDKFVKRGSHNINVPAFVFSWPQRLQAAFLRWLFNGDGSVKHAGKGFAITYSTASEQLARDTVVLLSGFGILVNLSSETRAGYDGKYWVLQVRGNKSRDRFKELIGQTTSDDVEKMSRKATYLRDSSVIPNQHEYLTALLPFVRGVVKEKCRECIRQHRRVSLNETRLAAILAAVDVAAMTPEASKAFAHLTEIRNRAECVSFQRVSAIRDIGYRPVFDVETSSDESHIVSYNGLLTHQSVVFGYMYGRTAKAIAIALRQEGVNITLQEAQQFVDALEALYPDLKIFLSSCRARVKVGFIATMFGRYRRFPFTRDEQQLKKMEREAMNAPIQGAVADAMNLACSNIQAERKRLGMRFKIPLAIHDAVLLMVPQSELDEVCRPDGLLKRAMIDHVPLIPRDLDGRPLLDGEVHRFGSSVDVHTHWGELLPADHLMEIGLSPEFVGWGRIPGGWLHFETETKVMDK